MKNYIKIIYLFLLSVLFYSCTSEQNKPKDKNLYDNEKLMDSSHLKINFDSAVIIIDSAMGQSWDRNDKLMLIPIFRELYEHSPLYLDDAIFFLRHKNFTSRQPSICLYAMQNLAIEGYLKLGKVYLELYDKQKISEYGLLNVVMPNFLEKKIIIDNYKNPNVINFLKIIKDKEKISNEFKGHIENILSGNR